MTTRRERTESITTTVTDANDRDADTRVVRVTFFGDEPTEVEHAGRTYYATGKRGTNVLTGRDVVSLATENDARVWLTLDATALYED